MKRRIFVGSAALVALLGTALVLRPDSGADAAPGDVDLEVEVSGTYDDGVVPHQSTIQVEVGYDDHDGALTVPAEEVVVDLNLVTTDYVDSLPPTVEADTTYDEGTFVWDIGQIDPGQTMTLVIRPRFTDPGGGTGTVSVETIGLAGDQTDIDSTATAGGTIGDQDDEAVYRVQDTDDADPFEGLVWNDVSGDGFFDLGEPPVEDTFVRIIDDVSGATVFWGRTDAAGTYSYGHLPDSTVDVALTQPAGFTFTTQQAGPNGSDPDGTGVVAGLVVTAANRAETDAGLIGDADLMLAKSADEPSGTSPFTPTYEIEVFNDGPSAASGVVVEDVLQSAAGSVGGFVESHGTATFDDPSDTITWDFGGALLLAGETATLTYQATYTGLGTFANEAQVTAADQGDPDSAPDPSGTTCASQAPDDDCDAFSVEVVPEAVPQDDEVLVPQGVPVTFNPLDNDGIFGRSAGDPLPSGWDLVRLTSTTQGSISCDDLDGECTYTPIEGYAGTDGFSYELTTPTAATFEQTVDIEVLHVNDGPTARDDRATTGIDTNVVVDVLANDDDPNIPTPGDTLTITDAGTLVPPGAGTWSCAGTTGPCTFDPAADFVGEATVTYEISDTGESDDRVDDPGVPGGIIDPDPVTVEADVTLLVDPDLLPTVQGFTGASGDTAEADTDPWIVATTVTTTAQCLAGRPVVTVDWTTVDRADSYLVERWRTGFPWTVLDRVDEPTLQLVDELVGEGTGYLYRVTPYIGRWAGAPWVSSVTTPALTSPSGCT